MLLGDYAAAWADGRAAAIAAFWEPAAFRFYKAEEIAEPLFSWDAALAYWHGNEALHQSVTLRFDTPVTLPLGESWSLLVVRMWWDVRFTRVAPPHLAGKAMGGDNHVVALLSGDRLAGWCEAPDAPLTYVRRLYETAARIEGASNGAVP